MQPTDVIAQLFGDTCEVFDGEADHIIVNKPVYCGATFLNAKVNWATGIATMYDQAGHKSLELAIKAELVPITE